MGGRIKSIPSDVKTKFDADSPWHRYPSIFGGVGVASLLLAAVISTAGGSEHGDHAPATQHQEAAVHADSAHATAAAPADGHGEGGSGKGADDHGGDKAGHGEDHGSDHGTAAGHAEEGGHHGGGLRFFYSYLTAYMYGLSLGLGGLLFVVLQFLVRAGWSVVVRRIAENIMATLPLFALLFVPVAFGLHDTHGHWWNLEVGVDALVDGKRSYLNQPFFLARAAFYLGAWAYLSNYFYKWSTKQDETGDLDISRRLVGISPVAIIITGLTLTFAAIDWMKSMDPHWYSTMWGVYYFAGCLVAIFSSMSVFIIWLQRMGYVQKIINEEHFHDLGKLLFGFNVFWTYIAFSQYFLIWYANIPEEQLWFEHRSHGGWREFGMFLAVGHFFIPFFFMLPRAIKRNTTTLFIAAVWMLFIHYVDMYFIVMPQFSPAFDFSIVDVLALVGIVSLFFAVFSYRLVRSHLVPIKDPRLPESLAFQNI